MNKTVNKFLLLILIVTMAVTFSFAPLTAYAWEGEGNGTLETPYLIKTVVDLVWIAEQVNVHSNIFQNVYFALNNDIDFEGIENWMPIGRTTALQGFASEYFSGHFDGRGNTIKNLTISRPDESYIGLFGWISGGTVENLNLIDCNITGKNYVGGIVGSINAYGTIRNCFVDGGVIGYDYVGGITGYNGNGNEIHGCHNAAKVTGNHHYTGGIVGGNVQTIVNCCNNGEVRGVGSYVGGIAGSNNDPPYLALAQ